jgi:hypothetical protein
VDKKVREFTIITPQFTRERDRSAPASPPADTAAFEALSTLDAKTLKELGLRPWGEPEDNDPQPKGGPCLWLFPSEWYLKIPEGFPIVDIFFKEERFGLGQTDDDIRLGMLSFGIMGPKP